MVGRYVNLRTEIKPVATDQLLSTFLMQGQWVYELVFCLKRTDSFIIFLCIPSEEAASVV